MTGGRVTLSLISHTNVGKTTLARTLLRRDVGEVMDREHVTEASEAHTLISVDGSELRLWDTPGFGNLHRLIRRLRGRGNPVGWFLHQVWDRFVDRPLWSSQLAARNVKDEADVVLYLVNAAEEPEDAGYVAAELELLTWMDRPVLLLLNQIGHGERDLTRRWREQLRSWPIVRDVLPLDAFARCWTEESVLLRKVSDLLDRGKRETMERLVAAWNERNLLVFRTSCRTMSEYLAAVAVDREAPDSRGSDEETGAIQLLAEVLKFAALDKRRAMATLSERLDGLTGALMRRLIVEHGLYGDSAAKIERRVQDFQVRHGPAFNERSGALAGAVVSGALGGLAADALTGGLSLGGGMIAGGILGALGGSALARGYQLIGGEQDARIKWTGEFLDELFRQALLRYLAVAHFGRGRGQFEDVEHPDHWSATVEAVVADRTRDLARIWEKAEETSVDEIRRELDPIIESGALDVLRQAYPEAEILRG